MVINLNMGELTCLSDMKAEELKVRRSMGLQIFGDKGSKDIP